MWRTDILIVIGAVVGLVVIIGCLAIRYLRGDEEGLTRQERAEIISGLMASERGETEYLGSFEEYADEELRAEELHRMNADVLASDFEVVPAGTYVDLSDDPDLIEWDLRQQASRCKDIVTVGFPRLRTLLALEYQRAEHEVHAHWAAA